ncbi:MAG: phosphoribosylanthranilate isomerase [bacterium]|nr:phosphoribosylanthranilate isomerase [bacterium]
MPKVKICGITRLPDAQNAIKAGASALGFNFYKKSPRYISPEAAAEIVNKLASSTMAVGLFVNSSIDEIIGVLETSSISALQLHGSESPEFIKTLRSKTEAILIKALPLKNESSITEVLEFLKLTDFILLDAWHPDLAGGTGKIISSDLLTRARNILPLEKCFLAGGLNPENVQKIHRLFPAAWVDVASGVETSPGIKNEELMLSFVRAISG